jgi:hypothetical protein
MQRENWNADLGGRYSAEKSGKHVQKRIALTKEFAIAIRLYIDRINRKGADLEMSIDAYDATTRFQKVNFWLKHTPTHQVSANLEGNLLKYDGMYWGGPDDLKRLVPWIFRTLVVMEANKQFESEMSLPQRQNHGM